ncbi:hypothetical protein [Pseudomonas indica]|uniref:Uncharacterized protein n=1 Tax=Pseudomonas indica TaxID=137658 RepID=A0A1G9AUC9_9PSED|nr:hypothetical protein [Pseudomonas indica]SDK30195.1 hypothetical protein SAMN05216186_10628 [Pseudomonas indica]
MAPALIKNIHYVDPVLPEQLPDSIIEKADALPAKVAFLDGILAPETGARLARLLQITNTYYSNMIEGQYTELVDMQRAQNAPRRERRLLQDLAVKHMQVQLIFERAIRMTPRAFTEMYSSYVRCTIDCLPEPRRMLFASATGGSWCPVSFEPSRTRR